MYQKKEYQMKIFVALVISSLNILLAYTTLNKGIMDKIPMFRAKEENRTEVSKKI